MTIRGIQLSQPRISASVPRAEPMVIQPEIFPGFPSDEDPLDSTRLRTERQTIMAPLPTAPPPPSLPPQEGFVVIGDITLFGISDVKAQLEIWEGPAPAGITILPNQPPSIEQATVLGDIRISSLLPFLKDSELNRFTFRDVTFYHQNYPFDKTRSVGWHFRANWVIDEATGAVYDILKKVLNVEEPVLNVSSSFDQTDGWNEPLSWDNFSLEGTFSGVDVSLANGVNLTTIGVRFYGIPYLKYVPTPHSALHYGFEVFGKMSIYIDGTTIPLELDYTITGAQNSVYISADVPKVSWPNAFGVSGLVLHDVSLSTSFSFDSKSPDLSFGLSAQLLYGFTNIVLEGSYGPNGQYALGAQVTDFDMNTVSDLFKLISRDTIDIPDIDVKIGSASIYIASGKEFEISLHNVDIAGHTSANATLAISPTGILLRGDLTSNVATFGNIEVQRAYLQVRLDSKRSPHGKRVDTIIGGEVNWANLGLAVGVHIYPSSDNKKSTEWTILAALDDGNSFKLSEMISELDGTPFDLDLKQVVFVAASKDDPSLGQMITSGYTFHEGVQLCATLNRIPILDSLIRSDVLGLVLNASWSKATGFQLDLALPTPMTLNLGNGIKTTPIKLSIDTKPPQLALSAGIEVPVPHSTVPLVFTFALAANAVGASAHGEMKGWWINPFGLSQNVKIGPTLGISLEIIFAQFLATGTPSGFGISGGLMIGSAQAQFALYVSEDPMRELLYAEVGYLGLGDLTSFVGDLTGAKIPSPPEDLLYFNQLKIYICPIGMTVGTITYPEGFSFLAAMTIFGVKAEVACAIVGSEVTLRGSINNMKLGPLTIRGMDGPKAMIECSLGQQSQHILVDGVAALFGAETSLHIEVWLYPRLSFSFKTSLAFEELVKFEIGAQLIGAVTFENLWDADFEFYAELEQHIMEYIKWQLIHRFDQARRAARSGIATAEASVSKAREIILSGISKAQSDVDTAYEVWQSHRRTVVAQSNLFLDSYNASITRLQNDITRARKDFDDAMDSARQAVTAAENERTRSFASARHAFDDAQRKMVADIASAQSRVTSAEADMHRRFGSAKADAENARAKVRSIQNEIDDIQGTIDDYIDASPLEFWKKGALPGLYIALGVLMGSKEAADGVLRGAQGVLASAEFLAAQAALNVAKQALESAQRSGSFAVSRARASVAAADAASKGVLIAANESLLAVQTGTQYVAFEGAKQALEGYKQANSAAFKAATDAINDLMKSAEYLAYQSAEGVLSAASAATATLDAAEAALDVARETVGGALSLSNWVFSHLTEAFDIQGIILSGTLKGLIGEDGKVSKPLTARVKGLVAGQSFELLFEFDPRRPAGLITSVFKYIWREIEGTVGSII